MFQFYVPVFNGSFFVKMASIKNEIRKAVQGEVARMLSGTSSSSTSEESSCQRDDESHPSSLYTLMFSIIWFDGFGHYCPTFIKCRKVNVKQVQITQKKTKGPSPSAKLQRNQKTLKLRFALLASATELLKLVSERCTL